MNAAVLVLLLAVLADAVLGDPVYAWHPARLLGRWIAAGESWLRRREWATVWGGILLTASTALAAVGVYLALRTAAARLAPGGAWVVDVFTVYSAIALRDLIDHVRPVAAALNRGDLAGARTAIARVVGRDVTVLDTPGVARAAIETVGENLVDGFIAPVFWFVAGCVIGRAAPGGPVPWGCAGMLVFKAASTLDSMLGYRTPRYERIGKAGARLDDALNFLPARLAPAVMAPAALCLRDLQPAAGWRVFLRDRLKHASPNSAHGESFMAGALAVRLGGPTRYADGLEQKPWLGDGTPDAEAADVYAALRLAAGSGVVTALLAAGALWLASA